MAEPKKPDEKRLMWIAGAIARLEAERDGREYECDGGGTSDGAKPIWRPSYDLTLFPDIMYRAKPQPKYRPFANAVEAAPHVGRFIRTKNDNGQTYEIVGVEANRVTFGENRGGQVYPGLLVHCTFDDDGSPCGVLVEGES